MQVFNMQRLAVLTTALAQTPPDPDLIYEAMKDRIHQPYRKTLVACTIPLSHPRNHQRPNPLIFCLFFFI